MNRRKLLKILLAVVIIAVIGGAGFVAGKRSAERENNQANADSQTIYTSASDLRKGLNVTLAEHIGLTTKAMQISYEDGDSVTAVIDELDKNSQDVAKIIGSFYGDETKATFLKMWQDQITYFVNYTVSAKNDDDEGKEQALSDLEDYSQEAAEFFAELNNNLTVDSLKPLFTEHRDFLIASMDNYIAGNYSDSLGQESKAYAQVGKIADALAEAITKQFPDQLSQ